MLGYDPHFFPRLLNVVNHIVLLCCSDLLVLSSSFRYVVRSGSPTGTLLKKNVSTGLMNLNCSVVKSENSAVCVLFLIV